MNIPQRPRFKPWFHVEIVALEGVYLLSETGNVVLAGERNCRLAPYLNGAYTMEAIVECLRGQISAAEVYFAIGRMVEKGYVEEAEGAGESPDRNFWQALTFSPESTLDRLKEMTFSITSLGGVESASLAHSLEENGLTQVDEGAVRVVVTDDYLRPELAEFNAKALAEQRPWVLVKLIGVILWVGPLFVPNHTGCWDCLAQRLRMNREADSYLQYRRKSDSPFPTSRASLPSTLGLGAYFAATEITKWIAQGVAESGGKMLTLNTLNMSMLRHTLVRRPQCSTCGDDPHRSVELLQPLTLRSQKKQFTADGGHRVTQPEQVVETYSHHISPFIGAVRELERVPITDPDLMPVYGAGHNFARNLNLQFLLRGLRTKAAGKGVTASQAKASALAEALERYSGLHFGYEFRVNKTLTELGDSAIHPNHCMLYSEQQYRDRDRWNALNWQFAVVPTRFDETESLEWSPVWSLTHEKYKYLPTGYLYYNYPFKAEFSFWADSNGNAAGSTLEEAIVQGFLELVERDAVAMWWYNRASRPSVDLDSFDDNYVVSLRDQYEKLARPFWVLDVTNDFGIPAFVVVSRRIDKPVEDILVACGAHFDPKLALRRALTELNQFVPAVLPLQPDGTGEYAYRDEATLHWWTHAKLENEPYLAPNSHLPPTKQSDFAQSWTDDLYEDIQMCQHLVQERGMEMLVLDQTRPDIGLPTVKVIVPGMRHFWARYGSGRLYDIPAQLGWLPQPLSEEELNPTPLFI
ncbi:MAG: TOMM precursor leader peptide-binding protein [Cyanobacteria bacterium P01_G01_bin.54]